MYVCNEKDIVMDVTKHHHPASLSRNGAQRTADAVLKTKGLIWATEYFGLLLPKLKFYEYLSSSFSAFP
jgi:hypothetical protein